MSQFEYKDNVRTSYVIKHYPKPTELQQRRSLMMSSAQSGFFETLNRFRKSFFDRIKMVIKFLVTRVRNLFKREPTEESERIKMNLEHMKTLPDYHEKWWESDNKVPPIKNDEKKVEPSKAVDD